MSSKFVQHVGESYLVVRNYITEDRAFDEAKKFRKAYLEQGAEMQSGGIYTNSIGLYQDVNALVLLSGKVAELSELLGEAVLPTYAYTRSYFTDGELQVHVDRKSCEISCTVHLDSDKPWELQIYNVAGELVTISLNAGDALIFDGVNYKHNRLGLYEGEEYTQCFLHYVFAYGESSDSYFDIDTVKKLNPTVASHIAVYKDFIPSSVCDGIVNAAMEIKDWSPASITGEEIPGEREYRVCEYISTDNHKELDQILYQYVTQAISEYSITHTRAGITVDEGYSILKYNPGGKYDIHIDHGSQNNRAITIIFNLNDDYEGGTLSFFEQTYDVQLEKGTAIVFPSSFLYDHCIQPITEGVRFSMVTWGI